MALKKIALMLALALPLLLSGCTLKYGDSLLVAPRLPEEYNLLQQKLDDIMEDGRAFLISADTGSDRQSVQLKDLDGDGEDEAVAFFRTDSNMTQVYIFTRTEQGYSQVGMAEGPGFFRWVRYPKIDENGTLGVALARGQEALTGVTVYRMDEGGLTVMLDTSYSQMTVSQLGNDGLDELLLIRQVNTLDTDERYALSVYGIKDGVYKELMVADLCKDVRSVINISASRSTGNRITLFVDSRAGGVGNYVTDIIELDGTQAINLTMDLVSGEGSLSRAQSVLSRDIDGDGTIDVPVTDRSEYQGELQAAKETRASQLIWLGRQADGSFERRALTFHNVADAWYMLWPERWGIDVYARTTSQNYRQVTKFYLLDHQEPGDGVVPAEGALEQAVLYIHVFTGVDREQHSQMYSNVEIIKRTATSIYGYSIPDGVPEAYRLSADAVKSLFFTINAVYSDIY